MSSLILFGGVAQVLYGILLFLTSLFLILLVLVQRGRGGGLAGAFGGMGGQSAFGAKAGDTFTKITIVAASFWIVLCLFGVKYMGSGSGGSGMFDDLPDQAPVAIDSASDPATSEPATDEPGLSPEVSTEEQVSGEATAAPPNPEGSLSAGSEDDS